jgi:hypothetical protein
MKRMQMISHGNQFYALKGETSLYEDIDKCQQAIVVDITDEVSTIKGTWVIPILEVD